jgi:hypothetical protein
LELISKGGARSGLAVLVLTAMLAAGCGADAPAAPGADAMPTTFQPAVTIYAAVPAATETPTPGATSQPTAAPSVALPTATHTPQPADGTVNPFTGQRVSDPAVLDRIPLLIKVANTSDVRPQNGLGSADVVVEHYAEGGITRFTALYLANAPEKIGSVRSCRLIDIELPRIFGAGLVCSGTSPGVKPTLRASWLFDAGQKGNVQSSVVIISDFGPFECPTCPMFRTSDRAAPHNLFANTANAWRVFTERDKNARTAFASWSFSDAAPAGGAPASAVDIPYSADPVRWTHDAATGLWSRASDGAPHTDADTGRQLTAANVVVLYAYHAETLIQEDTTGARSIQVQLWGEGPLSVYRDGRRVDGMWRRPNEPNTLEFVDAQGAAIPLKPGNTWIEVVPLDFGVRSQ